MKKILFTTVALIFLTYFSAPSIFAQTEPPCGNIIIPANSYYSQSEQSTPIVNCSNPFNADTNVNFTAVFALNGIAVTDDAIVTIPIGENKIPLTIVMTPRTFNSPLDIYKHTGNNYTLTYSAGQNISNPTQIEFSPGKYSAVLIYTEPPMLNQSNPTIWQKIFASIIPTTFAYYSNSEEVQVIHFEVVQAKAEPTGASSVLFLPGIQASRLYKDGLGGTEDEIWVPDGNQDVRQLVMSNTGVSQNQVYTRNVLENLPLGGTVYDSFARSMVNLVQDKIIYGWTPFAYDWRNSIEDIVSNGTKYKEGVREAITEIEYLASSSYTGKVTIIGHSNGGLLAKTILKKLEQQGKSNLVDRVVFLASPQLGTPKAIGTILHGFDQEKLGGWAIDDVVARDVIQNMPGAYGLVTSQRYFNSSPNTVIKFENSTATQAFRTAYGPTIDSAEELSRFMIGTTDNRPQATSIDDVLRVNSTLLSNQLNLHNNTLDNWVASAGVEVVEVIGTGLDTVSGFEYRSFRERVCSVLGAFSCQTKDLYKPVPLISQNGDKTVMAESAEAYGGGKKKYFIDLNAVKNSGGKEEHYNITENPSIQKLIKNILLATTTDIEFVSNTNTYASSNRILLGSHSPVDIEVTTSNGKRVGRTMVGGVPGKEEGIPGSSYFEIGTSKYIIVPADIDYKLKLKGTGEGGLTFSLDQLSGNTQIPEISVRVATITASTTINVTYQNNTVSNLEIDQNGDGVTDTVLTPHGVDVTPKVTYKTLKDKINSFSLTTIRRLPLTILAEAAEALDKKSVANPNLTQFEVFILNQLEALAVSYQKKKWITKTNLEEIRFIIGKLK